MRANIFARFFDITTLYRTEGIYYVLQALFCSVQHCLYHLQIVFLSIAPNFDPSSISSITSIMIGYIKYETNKYKYMVRAGGDNTGRKI